MSQVSDYNIANASGASVRSDMNAVFDAIKTLNSGGSDPSNTAAFMPYVDTADSNNLKIRNSSNNGFTTIGPVDTANLGLLPRAGGTMTGPLLGDDGSGASSPAYSFDNDADTGMFRSGSNTIGFSTAGTTRVSISNAGLDMTNALPIRFQDSSGAPFVGLKAPSSVSSNVTFTFPAADGNSGEFLKTDGSGALSFGAVTGVPRGSVFCIAHTSIPSGYLECNGDALPDGTGTVQNITANFKPLRDLIGATLPDLRGEFIRGFDNGRNVDTGRSMLSQQTDQNKQHNHTATSSVTDSGHRHLPQTLNNMTSTEAGGNTLAVNNTLIGNYGSGSGTGLGPLGGRHFMQNTTTGITVATTTANDGGGETRPRNIAMMYIIKF